MLQAKFISILLGLILFPLSVLNAQEVNSHEIGFGYGRNTHAANSSSFAKGLLPTNNFDDYSTQAYETSGSFFFTYKHMLSDKWAIGTDFAVEYTVKEVLQDDRVIGERDDITYTIAFTGDYYHISKPEFRLYSGIGLGYGDQSQEFYPEDLFDIKRNRMGLLMFQVSLLGIRAGGKFAFQSEVGYGYKGIISAGLRYQL